MKKILFLLLCCLTLISLTGCSLKAVGTWELTELTTKVVGFEKTYKIGEEYEGVKLTSDFTYIELKMDGTGTLAILGSEPTDITWELDGDDLTITNSDNLTIEAELEDGYLVFDMSMFGTGLEFKLAKKGLF